MAAPTHAPADASILIVDDDGPSREAVSELLTSMGYDVQQAGTADEAMQLLMAGKPDVLLTDIVLPGQSGIELAKAAFERHPGILIVFASGGESPPPEALGFDFAFLRKPFTAEQLQSLIAAMHGQVKQKRDDQAGN